MKRLRSSPGQTGEWLVAMASTACVVCLYTYCVCVCVCVLRFGLTVEKKNYDSLSKRPPTVSAPLHSDPPILCYLVGGGVGAYEETSREVWHHPALYGQGECMWGVVM